MSDRMSIRTEDGGRGTLVAHKNAAYGVVTIIERDMNNEDGMWYGIHVTVRGTKDTQVALEALVEIYGEERVYGSNSIIDQFRWSFVAEEGMNDQALSKLPA